MHFQVIDGVRVDVSVKICPVTRCGSAESGIELTSPMIDCVGLLWVSREDFLRCRIDQFVEKSDFSMDFK